MAAEITVSIGSIAFNDYTPGSAVPDSSYLLRKTPDIINNIRTRVGTTPKQSEHGVFDSLSFYSERTMPFEGIIVAPSQLQRVAMETALKQQLSLSSFQDYAGDDGYKLVTLTLEDATEVQIYAKIIDPPRFDVVDSADPKMREFSFVMMARDPIFYGTELKEASGTEGTAGTNFTVRTNDSPTIPFKIFLQTSLAFTCDNAGTMQSPPIITISGPTDSPQVTNRTTGVFMLLDGLTLVDGESVTIDVLGKTILKDNGDDLSGYLSATSDWIYLDPGDNEMSATDATASELELTITMQWRDAYI